MKNICILLFFYSMLSFSQTKFYNYNIYDGKDYSLTMNQSNDLILNSIRLIGNEIDYYSLTRNKQKLYFNQYNCI